MGKNVMKSQKPRANSKYQQGTFVPSKPDKYCGDLCKIYFRSSWELTFMRFCDSSPNILQWAAEPNSIPYWDPLSKKARQYYVDFAIVTRDESGGTLKWLIEIKPEKFLTPPKTPTRMTDKQTANFLYAAKQYIVNKAKFEAAREFAATKGFRFGIITENFSIINI